MKESLQKIVYGLLALLLLYFLVYYLQLVTIIVWLFHICMPLFIAFVFRFIMDPIISFFSLVPRKIVCILTYVVLIFIGFVFLYYTIPELVENIEYLHTNYDLMHIEKYIHPFFKPIYSFSKTIRIWQQLGHIVMTSVDTLLYWIGNICLGFFISFYLVLDNIQVTPWIENHTSSNKRIYSTMLQEIKEVTCAFLKATCLDFIIFFVASLLLFWLLGFNFVVFIAFFLAFTNMIPYIGPFIGGIPVIIYGFTMHLETGYMSVLAIAFLQVVESNFIQPYIFKKQLDTHPIIVILALGIFGDWFGVIGMILSPLLVSYCLVVKDAIKKRRQMVTE